MRHRLPVGTICLYLLIHGLFISCQQQPMTAKRVVDECAQAMGGMEQIQQIKTLRVAYNWPDHGILRYEIKRPNKVRMGDNLVFDGERASWLEGVISADGSVRKAELVPQEEWKDYEMDIGWFFPAFFEYGSEYIGMETLDSVETYRLKVILPLGACMNYYLDAKSHLIYRITSDTKIGDKEYHMERTFSDYRLCDGISYPHTFTYAGRDGITVLTATAEKIEFNVPLGEERFAIPESVDDER